MPGSSNARPVICSVNVTKTSAVSQGPRKMLRLLLTWNWPYPTFCAFVLLLYFNRRKIRGWMSFFACCWKRQVRPDNSPSRRYLGLRNEGSTCYLNSILQCLFMTPEFTNSILSERDVIVNADRTVKKLQKLFIDLRFGNSTPSTRKLMNSLGIESGKQQDVEEYFRFLLNSIPEKMEAQKLFHIQVVHSITCEKCNTKDVIPYTWLSLPVSIKEENPSVQAAIDSFLKKLRFEGENRCYCENCGSKQDSISRNYFISLPRVLVIHLKRYEIYRGHFQKKFTAVSVENSLKIPLKKGRNSLPVNVSQKAGGYSKVFGKR